MQILSGRRMPARPGNGHEASVADVRAKKESAGGMWSEKTGLETVNKDNFPGSSAIKK